MTFQDDSLKVDLFKHNDLDEAHQLDIDSNTPPLSVDAFERLFKSTKTEIRGVWQTATFDDYVTDAGEEYSKTETRLVGFIIYLEYKDKPTDVYRLSVHYAADYRMVAGALLDEIKGPVVTTVRQRNLSKKLLSFLKARGFINMKTRGNEFSRPIDAGVFFRYDVKKK